MENGTGLQVYDEQSTLSQMMQAGEVDKYLYSFKQGGKDVCDLNVAGINRLAIAVGVSIEDVEIIEEDETQITVRAIAINADGIKHHGIVRESKFTPSGYPNPHALANATSKAQRNAKKGLLPMAEVREVIRGQGRDVVQEGDDNGR